jgi:hypothetical protein
LWLCSSSCVFGCVLLAFQVALLLAIVVVFFGVPSCAFPFHYYGRPLVFLVALLLIIVMVVVVLLCS